MCSNLIVSWKFYISDSPRAYSLSRFIRIMEVYKPFKKFPCTAPSYAAISFEGEWGSPPPPSLPWRVRIFTVEDYSSCVENITALRNVGGKTSLRTKRGLPFRCPSEESLHFNLVTLSTVHCNSLFICLHTPPRSISKVRVAIAYFIIPCTQQFLD